MAYISPSLQGSVRRLGQLDDVSGTATATNGQVLSYNSTTRTWEPKTDVGSNTYVGLTDVDVSPPTNGLMTHYVASTGKFTQATETKVDPVTRNVIFDTAGTFAAFVNVG